MISERDPGAAGPPAIVDPVIPGGAGLADHTAADPVPRRLHAIVGVLALAVLLAVGATIWAMEPALGSDKALGTADQVGKLASGPSAAAPVVKSGSDPAIGKQLIGKYGCGGCHTIPGIESAHGNIGPNLGGVASRTKIAGGAVPNTGPADLEKWIMDPPAQKPGTQMPKLGVTQADASKIVSYLELLK